MTEYQFKIYVGCDFSEAPLSFIEEVASLMVDTNTKGRVLNLHQEGSASQSRSCLEMVRAADLMIAVCQYGSISLGWDINEALGAKTFVLACALHENDVARRVRENDDPRFEFRLYDEVAEISGFVEKWLEWQSQPEKRESESYVDFLYRLAITNPEEYEKLKSQARVTHDGDVVGYHNLKAFYAAEQRLQS